MGTANSMSIARLVMLENASQNKVLYPIVMKTIEDNSYADDISVMIHNETDVL